jgi:hypothetical protein
LQIANWLRPSSSCSTGTANLAAAAVTSDKIADGAVAIAKLANAAVTSPKIASNAVDSGKIVAAAVTAPKLADAAVTAPKLAAGFLDPIEDAGDHSLAPFTVADADSTHRFFTDAANNHIIEFPAGLSVDPAAYGRFTAWRHADAAPGPQSAASRSSRRAARSSGRCAPPTRSSGIISASIGQRLLRLSYHALAPNLL